MSCNIRIKLKIYSKKYLAHTMGTREPRMKLKSCSISVGMSRARGGRLPKEGSDERELVITGEVSSLE